MNPVHELALERAVEVSGDERVLDLDSFDGRRLPHEDGSYDAVISVGALGPWFEDPAVVQTGLTEIARVLRPGGRAWLIEPAGPAGEDAWTLERWGKAMSGARLGMRASIALRGRRPTPMGWLASRGSLGANAAAAAELAYNRRRGVRGPYTECLLEAVRL
ncbi:MAG: class I SAM-dependent methyltransferase [Thermoleophilaceae bacterium]|nr:class I SAM-dependent methyltransferase [Thermoleophilaceae bacterium]